MSFILTLALVGLIEGMMACRPGADAGKTESGNKEDTGTAIVTSAMMLVSEKYIDACKGKILGNFSKAEELLKECLNLDHGHHPSWYQLADIHHIQGNYQDAVYAVEQAIGLDNTNIWYKVLYADLLLKVGRYDEAEKVYREIIRMKPGKRIWYEARAHAQTLSGNLNAAAETYQEILDRFGYDEDIFFKMIRTYETEGNVKKIEKSLDWLVKKFPYDTRYLGRLAGFYNSHGKTDKAFTLWQEILKIEPDNGEVRFDLAGYYRGKGDDQKAYNELYSAFTTPNLSIDAKIVVMLSYFTLTERYPQMLPEAYRLLDLMVEKHPENPKGWSMYADFFYREQRYEEALARFKSVVELDSSRFLVWEKLLHCALMLNDFQTLRDAGTKALRIFPDQAVLYLYYGTGLYYGNQHEASLTSLKQGYFFTGLNDSLAANFLYAMARSYEAVKETDKAADHYHRAHSAGLASAIFLSDYIRFATENGMQEKIRSLEQALQSKSESDPLIQVAKLWLGIEKNTSLEITNGLTKITATFPDRYAVMEQAGFLFRKVGQKEKAQEVWKKAISLSSGNHFLSSYIDQ